MQHAVLARMRQNPDNFPAEKQAAPVFLTYSISKILLLAFAILKQRENNEF